MLHIAYLEYHQNSKIEKKLDINVYSKLVIFMASTMTGKPRKMRVHFPARESQGILNILERSWNFTQNTGKVEEFYTKYMYWKSDVLPKILQKWGDFIKYLYLFF